LRYLRNAAHEGPRAFARSLAGFPHRHPFWIAGTAFGVVAVLGILGYYETNRQVTRINRHVTKIEAASPCLTYGPKSDLCKESFEKAVLTITHAEACAVERKAGTLRAIRELAAVLDVTFAEPCAHARLRQERIRHQERVRSKGVVDSNGHAPSSQLGPRHGGSGHKGQGGGTSKPPTSGKGKKHAASEPRPESAPEPSTEASTSSPPPEASAGNSGETPAAQNAVGVKACIEVAVSACADAGLPKPQLP
jgi:hypothetical protein